MVSNKNKYQNIVINVTLLCISITTISPGISIPAYATSDSSTDNSGYTPTGTLLLPLTPKLDSISTKASVSSINSASTNNTNSSNQTNSKSENSDIQSSPIVQTSAEKGAVSALATDSGSETINENATLKGTIQIVADDTEFDQDKNTFLGTGNAIALIGGQNSKLQADSILFDQNNQIIDARGNVSILRDGQLTTGSAFKFNVNSDEYLITQPETQIEKTQIVARKSIGTKNGVAFKDGTMDMPVPFFLAKNMAAAPIGYAEQLMQTKQHPQAYVPDNPSFKFKAKKMIYERYKETENLTILGGRLEFGDFSIPVGTMVTTVGQTDFKTVMAVSPYMGNNLWSGGLNLGPQFNTAVGKKSVFSWSPMVQLGGRPANDTTGSSIGLAGRIAFTNPLYQAHLAYGSVSNLLIGDFKASIWKTVRLQSGINRFLQDGMLGMTRARIALELYDNHPIYNIPYLSSLNFHTSAGWYQDNPQLVYVSATYAALHGNPNTTTMNSGYKVQEQVTFTTHPIFNYGDDKYGAKAFIYGGVAARGYSTGNSSFIGQLCPILDVHMNRVRLQGGYTTASVSGSSPFVFDEYVQGSSSVFLQGDVRLSKYLSVGGVTGYNMTQKLSYAKTLVAAIGPPDLKLIFGKDFILNNYRVGFNVLYGQPVQFDKLVFKGGPDQGQLGNAAGGI